MGIDNKPSHEKAPAIPYDDFDVNAGGTLNFLVAAAGFLQRVVVFD